MTPFNRYLPRLFEPRDAAGLVFFRVSFGLVMLWHVVWFCTDRLVELFYVIPPYHLTYFGFEWVKPLPGIGMRLVFYVMGLAAVGITLGLFYRLSCVLFFLTFTYSFLAEAALYQNHYYLVCLIAFLLIWIPANRVLSLDALFWPQREEHGHHSHQCVPAWCYGILRFQIAVPYIYGGIAKLNWDWLHAMPVGLWIEERSDLPLIGPHLAERWCAWFVSYSGLILDLAVVPLLLWRPTRLIAYLAIVAFHLLNGILFTIDFFPWFMILATPIFFPPNWPRRLLRLPSVAVSKGKGVLTTQVGTGQRTTAALLAMYVAWQVLFPFRHVLYPGNPSWTEEGHLFAWRMMLRRKEGFVRFYATDGATGRMVEIPVDQLFNPRQLMEIAVSPDQLVAVAPFLAERAKRVGFQDAEIRVVAIVSLNGRKPQLMIDPDVDLTTLQRTWKHQPWVIPLHEPLRDPAWRMPSDQWPSHLGIELPPASPDR